MHKTVVINAVGLTHSLIGEFTPRLRAFRDTSALANVQSVFPAVTTSVQSTYLTGTWPSQHGIVGNGWYFRDECEVHFWKQSSRLVQRPRVWDLAKQRDPAFTCANLFWWYAMYSAADYTVTPRPMYLADGRKIPDVWTNPGELRASLQNELGQFPLFKFWGPATTIESTQWIASAAMAIDRQYDPTLNLIYLPHLDYCLQRRGPGAQANSTDLRELDAVCGQLIDHFQSRRARVIILSEYGIAPVSKPVHLNRVLRENGLLTVREERGHELLDAGASKAFAVADHQVAHVYVNHHSQLAEIKQLLEKTPGVERVLDDAGKREFHIDHARAGDLIAIAAPESWFTYYYWLEESKMPDFARTVDIHRKPGYDPAELFIDPKIKMPKAKIGMTLLRRKLGFRSLLEVIPTDANLVRGSHGRPAAASNEGAMIMTPQRGLLDAEIAPTAVCDLILKHVFES